MTFMQAFIYPKGRVYSADCRKCGTSHYIHEWITDAFNEERDAMQAGTLSCDDCYGKVDGETFTDCGRLYAGRYSAPGYLDCTQWAYSRNKRTLERELRDLYGDQD